VKTPSSATDRGRAAPALSPSDIPRSPGKKAVERILLVDDDADALFVLADYLRQCGFEVDCAENVESALARLHQHRPDLIMLDVLMPGVDGFEACEMLKANPRDREIPVLFVTGLHDAKEKVKAFEVGAVDYITKPINPVETLARIRLQLRIHSGQRQIAREQEKLHREMLRQSNAVVALQTSLDRALVVTTSSGEILFCSASAASLLHRYIPDMAPRQLPPGLLGGGDVGMLKIELVPAPEAKDCLLLTMHVARPPASFRDLLPLGLTGRETEILYWITQGKTSPEVGLILGITGNTVKAHVQHILPKLGVETRFAAALLASEFLQRLHAGDPGRLPPAVTAA
jgi:DNA-binding response OmpR family regulator/DNA-binding CsgD family transcriptional regulator